MKFMKTLLASAILILMIAAATALAISITPAVASDNRDLTCATDSNPTAYVYKWYNEGSYVKSGQILGALDTTIGENWTCKVFIPANPMTGEICIGEAKATIMPANNIPTVPTITLSPNAPYYPFSVITATAASTDADNDVPTYEYRYERAGITISTTRVLSCSGLCSAGDSITIYARAYDGKDYSAWQSASFTISSASLFSTVINSYINGDFYSGTGTYNNITGLISSVIELSSIYGTFSIDTSNILNSYIYDSNLSRCSVDSSGIDSSTCSDSVIRANSNVFRSNITGSNITSSGLYEANTTNSYVAYSTLMETSADNANVINDRIDAGTILMTNGSVYNATANGAVNLVDIINQHPWAWIESPGYDSNFSIGQIITFTSGSYDANIGTALNDSLTYLWDFGDGSNATTENATHAYSAAGNYTIMLTVTDKFNTSDGSSTFIRVNPATSPSTPTSPDFCPVNHSNAIIQIDSIKNFNSIDAKDFAPLDELKIRVSVKNNANVSKTVYVKSFIMYNNSEIKDTEVSESVKINDDGTKTVELNMTIPLDLKEGDYQLYIRAYDDNNKSNCDDNFEGSNVIRFQITRETNEVIPKDVSFMPSNNVSCGDLLTLSGKVANTGTEDEQKVKIVYTDDLKNKAEEVIDNLDWGIESKTFNFNINIPKNATESKYKATLTLSYEYNEDNNRYGTTKTFTYDYSVGNCKPLASTLSLSNVSVTTTQQKQESGFSAFINENWKSILMIVEILVVIAIVFKILLLYKLI
jgi:hypothetical protein